MNDTHENLNEGSYGGSTGTTCSPSSDTPRMDKAAYEATTRTVGKWIVPLAKAQHIEKELNGLRKRVRELEIVADLATGLNTGQDCDPAHHGLVCAAMTAMNFTENVKELATPLARASVETGVEVHTTGDVADSAASGGCVSRLVVPSSYCVEADLPGSAPARPGQVNNLEHDLGKMGYNRTTIAALIQTAQDYGVRMLESDFIDNQTAGSYEGVMIFRGEFSEILDGVLYRRISAGTIQQRLEAIRSVRKELPVAGFTLGAVDGFKSAGAESGDEVSHGGFGCHGLKFLHNDQPHP